MSETNYSSKKPDDLKLEQTKTYLKHLKSYKEIMTLSNNEALITAAKKHLDYDGSKMSFSDFLKSGYDVDKWKDADFQEKFTQTMTDIYVERGLKNNPNIFKETSAEKLRNGDLEDQSLYKTLSQHYGGITKQELQGLVSKHKDNFVNIFSSQIAPGLADRIASRIRDSAVSHIKDSKDHLDKLVEESVAPEHRKYFTRSLTREEAIELLETYSQKDSPLDLDDLKSFDFFNVPYKSKSEKKSK